jgi:hypothetical protein
VPHNDLQEVQGRPIRVHVPIAVPDCFAGGD